MIKFWKWLSSPSPDDEDNGLRLLVLFAALLFIGILYEIFPGGPSC